MKTQKNYIFKGLGSIVNIYPMPNYENFVYKDSPSKRMRNHWLRAGSYIQNNIERFDDEQKKEN